MKLSKEQIAVLAKQLSTPYGGVVKLACDGYQVQLVVERCKGMTYRVMTYVNGNFKGLWCNPKNECPESKFMRKLVRPVWPVKHKQTMEEILGKKRAKSDPRYSATSTSYWPDWASGKAALSHLNKVCESVQLAE